MRLSGKVALVTGAASGIGRAIAELMAAEGAVVVVTDIDAAAGRTTVDTIEEVGNKAEFLQLDVADENSWQLTLQDVMSRHGQLDVMVNNAGVALGGPIADATIEDWRWVMSVNLDGTFPRHQICDPGHAPSRRRHRQYFVGHRNCRPSAVGRGFGQQGRGTASDQDRGPRVRRDEIQYPRQFGTSRVASIPTYLKGRAGGPIPVAAEIENWKHAKKSVETRPSVVSANRRKLPTRFSFWPRTRPASSPAPNWSSMAAILRRSNEDLDLVILRA